MPHTAGLAARWSDLDGVEVEAFRYAPARLEVLGYGRSLQADETPRVLAAAVTPSYLLAARRAVSRAIDARTCDVVQAHWLVPNAVALNFPWRWPGQGGPAVLTGLHGSDVFMAEKGVGRMLARRALPGLDGLTGCSPELVERIVRLGFPEDRASTIPYGVDAQTFCPGDDTHGWRSRLGIPEDAVVLLGVGRMATKKGFQHLVARAGSLLEAVPDAWIVLAGGGDLEPGFKDRCRGLRVAFPGPVERDVLPDLYRAADAFVLPAVHDSKGNVDGLPNVILEAMATGLPVVASSISGIPQAVEHETNGLLIEEADEEGLEAALTRLAREPSLRTTLGEQARRKVETELTWDQVAARYRDAYRQAMRFRARGASR